MTNPFNPYAQAAARADRPSDAAGPREVEAWALTTAAHRLKAAAANTREPTALRDALILNQRLWTIFQTDLMGDNCPLPQDLRKSLLELSMFIDGETLERLADLDGSKIQSLVDINLNLASGLREGTELPTVPTRPAPVAAWSQPAAAQPVPQATVMPPADAAPRPLMISA